MQVLVASGLKDVSFHEVIPTPSPPEPFMRKPPYSFAIALVLATTLSIPAQNIHTEEGNFALWLFGDYDNYRKHAAPEGINAVFSYSLQYTDKVLAIRKARPHFGDSVLFEYSPRGDIKIVTATFKRDNPLQVFVGLSDGSIMLLFATKTGTALRWYVTYVPRLGLASFGDIMGDALYGLASGKVWASVDSAKTWKLDTAGIYGESVTALALDPSMNVWAVTQSRKLYSQHKDSSAGKWQAHTGFVSDGFPTTLFIDRLGRFFAGSTVGGARIRVSTDTGATWNNVSAGVNENIASFADDDKGNVYAVGQVSGAYRLTGLTPPWVPIQGGIAAMAQVPAPEKIISSLSFDSLLFATTRYGVFTSSDSGAHWTHANDSTQTRTTAFYTPLVRAAGKSFLSTNLGIFRAQPDGKAWDKVFPQGKYCWGINALAADDAGNLYGNVPVQIDTAASRFFPVKSADQGDHWDLDTAGHGNFNFNSQSLDHFVDRQGNQWLGGNATLYCKKSGDSWKRDTAGLGIKSGEFIRQVSRNNKKGTAYASLRRAPKYLIYKRALADSAWQPVNTDTLAASDGILQSDQDGNLVVKVLSFPGKFWKYDGNAWSTVGAPPGNPDQFIVDAEGTLWASLLASNGRSMGLQFSTDNGATWKLAGLDSIPIKFLSTVKDTVFAVTVGEGVFPFTKASTPIALRPRGAGAPSLSLAQNHPNPFKPMTRIRYELPEAGRVRLEILDLRGQVVAMLDQGPRAAGTHQVTWDAHGRMGGMYVCRLSFRTGAGASTGGPGTLTAARKLLLLD